MKGKLLVSVFLAAVGTTELARAADMPLKAPPLVAPVYSWTSCYLGGHIGGGVARSDWSADPTDMVLSNTVFGSLIGATATIGGPSTFGSDTVSGFLGGGQIGCDYQFGSHIVLGAQADADWSNMQGNHTATSTFLNVANRLESETFNSQTSIDRFGTVSGRIGYASDRALFYFKGGGAWIHDSYTVSDAALIVGGTIVPNLTGAANVTRWGWNVGAGFEYALLPNLSAMIEYDYLAFNTASTAFSCSGTAFACGGNNVGPTFNSTFPLDVRQQVQVIRFGVNLHVMSGN